MSTLIMFVMSPIQHKSLMDNFLQNLHKIRQKEIHPYICKVQLQLEHVVNYKDVTEILDASDEWKYFLANQNQGS